MGMFIHGWPPFSHIWVAKLQTNPEGQQWAKSEQHTAWKCKNEYRHTQIKVLKYFRPKCYSTDYVTCYVFTRVTYLRIWTAAVSMHSHTAGGKIWTDFPIRTCVGAGNKPPHKHSHEQAQSYPQHLQRRKAHLFLCDTLCVIRKRLKLQILFSLYVEKILCIECETITVTLLLELSVFILGLRRSFHSKQSHWAVIINRNDC